MKKVITGMLAVMMLAGVAFSETAKTWQQLMEESLKKTEVEDVINYLEIAKRSFDSQAEDAETADLVKKYVFTSNQFQYLIDALKEGYASSSTIWKK